MDINELMERLNKIKEGQGDRSPSSDMDSKISALTSMGSGMDSDKFLGGLKEDTEEESIDPEFDKENDEYFKDVDDEISSDSVQPKTIPLPGSPPKPKVMYADSGQIKNDAGNDPYYENTKDEFLKNQAMLESNNGKNVKHRWITAKESPSQAGSRGIGKYAFVPNTIKEFAKRSDDPELKKLAKLDQMGMEIVMRENPELENKLADLMYEHLNKNLGGDQDRMSVAWEAGHNRKNISDSELQKWKKPGKRLARLDKLIKSKRNIAAGNGE